MLGIIERFPEDVRNDLICEIADRWTDPIEDAPPQPPAPLIGVSGLPVPVVFMLCGLWCRQNEVSAGTFIRDWTEPHTGNSWSVMVRPTVRPYGIVTVTENAKAVERAEETVEKLSSMKTRTRQQVEALEHDLNGKVADPNTRAHMQSRLDSLSATLAQQERDYADALEIVNAKVEKSWVFRLDKPLEISIVADERVTKELVLGLPLHATLEDLEEMAAEEEEEE